MEFGRMDLAEKRAGKDLGVCDASEQTEIGVGVKAAASRGVDLWSSATAWWKPAWDGSKSKKTNLQRAERPPAATSWLRGNLWFRWP